MIVGYVREYMPRVTLVLPGRNGRGALKVEFIVDTGFDGEIAVPTPILSELDTTLYAYFPITLADRRKQQAPHYEMELDWNEEARLTEVIVLEGNPLLGCRLLEGCSVNIDMVEGGEVIIEFS